MEDVAVEPDTSVALDAGTPAPVLRDRFATGRVLLDRPLTSYYLTVGISALLLALGLVMVLSTSSVAALDSGASPYSDFQKQLFGVAIGLPLMWAAARSSPRLLRVAAYPLLAVSVLGLLLALIPHVAVAKGGASRWIALGPFQLQPSEFAKLAFLLWGADLLARKEKLGHFTDWRQLLVPLMPGAGILCMLVMLGDDLGTTFVLLTIFLALLWVIGTPARVFVGMLALMGLVVLILIVVSSYRSKRLTSFVNPQGGPTGSDMQGIQGKWAVGSGGWFGVGLGASREKWGWVPDATTDFIFAIIGEELAPGGGGSDRVDRAAGSGEHRRGDRRAPDHRRPAPARLRGSVVTACDDGRARHADVIRQAGARSAGGFGRSRPRAAAARPKLAWPDGTTPMVNEEGAWR